MHVRHTLNYLLLQHVTTIWHNTLFFYFYFLESDGTGNFSQKRKDISVKTNFNRNSFFKIVYFVLKFIDWKKEI